MKKPDLIKNTLKPYFSLFPFWVIGLVAVNVNTALASTNLEANPPAIYNIDTLTDWHFLKSHIYILASLNTLIGIKEIQEQKWQERFLPLTDLPTKKVAHKINVQFINVRCLIQKKILTNLKSITDEKLYRIMESERCLDEPIKRRQGKFLVKINSFNTAFCR